MSCVSFRGTNLKFVRLVGASLDLTDFVGASMSGADLRHSSLTAIGGMKVELVDMHRVLARELRCESWCGRAGKWASP